ncbi:PepSY domain-containing protein [Tamlana sp. 2_MG-2023]|uniref:PepSY domain-containing protein n=1 Tax=unclassified Tamlana TaxID=2614803 RepID=UPI0026E4493B|nr:MULTISPECIES: PepSY domain-containing protein [unclassified Tamlana]MDO6760472.1 PepSY domain-containing protein [Tamlana sp. 2_MG-2023]MDO6790728.1 PepSY domain-containing protein [Tamlana sp. 1_MG-2023]
MTISIWRYSHLILAISSALFIILASVTGVILAFEPISHQVKPYAVDDAGDLPVSKTIAALRSKYDEVLSVEIDNNDFVLASVFTAEGDNEAFYINPFTAEKIGDVIEKAPIFKFATNLHRSLFLKTTGRFIIGFVSFLLFLMAVTGVLLIVKRQGGLGKFFSKVVKEDFDQYYHIIVGRYTLIPMVIVTLTGVYLSLEKFSWLPEDEIAHQFDVEASDAIEKLPITDLKTFNKIKLEDVKRIEFPFSDDIEDYYFLKLEDREIYVNQYDGSIVSQHDYGLVSKASSWSMILHTGQGSISWSLALLVTCFAILFFVYSGFAMTLKRKRNHIKIKNKFSKDVAEYIILIGSETGSTFGFAKSLYNALIAEGKSVFVSELNQYTSYKQAQHLVVLTATYGDGAPPTNANKFEKLVSVTPQNNNLEFAIVGFGSLAYQGFCEFAIGVDQMLQLNHRFNPSLPVYKINNQSFNDFNSWVKTWGESKNMNLQVLEPEQKINVKKATTFKVVKRTALNRDQSFVMELAPEKKAKFVSGDLLAIYPKNETLARQYSIGEIDGNIILSIKKHDFGVCSTYLNELQENDTMVAHIEKNKAFHFPKKTKEVVMISNGTGIAPFIGMINNEKRHGVKSYLFWGGRTSESFKMYAPLVDKAFYAKRLSGLYVGFSREDSQKRYVQDLLLEKAELIARVLKNGGVIMICGSVAMETGVRQTLERITTTHLNTPISVFEAENQIKTDCY